MNILKKVGLTEKINRKCMREFLFNYRSQGRVLDIGAGFSPYDYIYRDNFPNRTVLDIAESDKVDVVGDVHKLPFQENEFDEVLCFEVFEHLKNPFQAAKEIQRVLKPGGRLILTTRFIMPIHDAPDDYFRFTKYGIREIFKDMRIEILREEMNTLATLAFIYLRLGFQTKLFKTKLGKLFFFLMSKIIYGFKWMPIKEYGDIGQKHEENNIITSGYYLVAYKQNE